MFLEKIIEIVFVSINSGSNNKNCCNSSNGVVVVVLIIIIFNKSLLCVFIVLCDYFRLIYLIFISLFYLFCGRGKWVIEVNYLFKDL